SCTDPGVRALTLTEILWKPFRPGLARQLPGGEEARPTMSIWKPIAALAVGCLLSLGAGALAQSGGARAGAENSGVEALVLGELKNLDWIEKSEVAALREGVIDQMELRIGMQVKKGGTIGTLHREIAVLTVMKNKLQADSMGPTEK